MEQFSGDDTETNTNREPAEFAQGEQPQQEEVYTEQSFTEDAAPQFKPPTPSQFKTPTPPQFKSPNPPQFKTSIPSQRTHQAVVVPMEPKDIANLQRAHAMIHANDAIPPSRYATMREMTEDFWRERKRKMWDIPEEEMATKSKNMSVPMARVKKIMKIDEDVRCLNIASDAPIFMAQAAEFFIEEMTAMGWQYVSEARRRILQKSDVATAVKKNEQFDFLLDFLPQAPAIKPLSRNPPPRRASFNQNQTAQNLQNSQNGFKPAQKRSFPGASKAHTGTSNSFQCVQNETSRGRVEYQIVQTTSAGPSTSSPQGPYISNIPSAQSL
ncbi:Protein CBR-NFYC-1 [Caenorhabditis briggsae]|uniref:Transcription factor CBF/NF-Y/archaeal histone domain-containing protein n=2 Tax=Caenorhabditis briggsae TaxID=6238 RepID=A0AAE9J9Z5_CAEBR|nr:Protein CBR-NFYC-1 [Caenorhabditis briggsae]ULU09011.1 hypothetical protein L3Y34_019903 [Caenorhabditis briggsae]UMM20908.1 hypothetical protein L5515_015991 [Caenorhabditis briggsae]CAP27341.2 Protein CBR-NFYC-1 [Caenorhabditis briggsae]